MINQVKATVTHIASTKLVCRRIFLIRSNIDPDCTNKTIAAALIDPIVFKVVIRQVKVVEDQDTHCYVMSIIHFLKLTFPLTQYLIASSNFNIIRPIGAPISLLREQTGRHSYSSTTFVGTIVCFDLIFPNCLSKLASSKVLDYCSMYI